MTKRYTSEDLTRAVEARDIWGNRPPRAAKPKRVTEAQQDEAYDHGYRSRQIKSGVNGALGEYVNPYDSDKFWLLYMAYEQGWNDRAAWERKQHNAENQLQHFPGLNASPCHSLRRMAGTSAQYRAKLEREIGMYTIETTRVSKDHEGKWHAKTAILLAGEVPNTMGRTGQRVLNINTYKTDRGTLATFATAAVRAEYFESTILFVDFSKVVITAPGKRVTEKDVRNQHAGVLITDLPGLIAQMEAFYAAKDSKAA